MTEGLVIRPARPDDGEMLWHWRNNPEVRRASLTTEEIPLEQHLDWYCRALQNPKREVLFAELQGEPIGMVRFDTDEETTTVSILLAADYRGRGLAGPVLSAAMCASSLGRGKLRALVKRDNPASLRLFQSLGFSIVIDDDPIVLERQGLPE